MTDSLQRAVARVSAQKGKHKMRERNPSKLLGIAGFVALAAILAVEGFGISRSGGADMNGLTRL